MTTKIEVNLQWGSGVQEEYFKKASLTPNLPPSLIKLHRHLEKIYTAFPWPPGLNKIGLFTQVAGGKGDISAAAKVIGLLQRINPSLVFDWLVRTKKHDPQPFLQVPDPTKVTVRTVYWPSNEVEVDCLVVGPVRCAVDTPKIAKQIGFKLNGPRFDFLEICEDAETNAVVNHAYFFLRSKRLEQQINYQYVNLHEILFPASARNYNDPVMGLDPGSGVFLDESRVSAVLSRDYCCPSYLDQIKDPELKKDLFEALSSGDNIPDYEHNSLNFGYAHKPHSWAKFIDCVAVHEKEKNVIVVLNQHGEYHKPGINDFSHQVFTADRLNFLEELGYGKIILKLKSISPIILREPEEGTTRTLTLILSPAFLVNDMKWLQLASERLLATGDNTPAESWAARCRLYLYEVINECKYNFLEQQIRVANTISPDIGILLKTFGDKSESLKTDADIPLFNKTQIDLITSILNNPSFSQHTLQLCKHITQNYSFKEILEGSLKRTAWHHCIPGLMKAEAETIDDSFKSGVTHFILNQQHSVQVIHNLPLIAERVNQKVQKYLNQETN